MAGTFIPGYPDTIHVLYTTLHVQVLNGDRYSDMTKSLGKCQTVQMVSITACVGII